VPAHLTAVAELERKPMGVELLLALDDLSGRATLTELKRYQNDWETHHVDYRGDICENLGLVAVDVMNEDEPGKAQRVWSLTDRGRSALAEWTEKYDRPTAVDDSQPVPISRGEYRRLRRMADVMDGLLDTASTAGYDLPPADTLALLVKRIDYMDEFLARHAPHIIALSEDTTERAATEQRQDLLTPPNQ
jgi:hypothetical protein